MAGAGREATDADRTAPYDPDCYLCPGNERAGGARNPAYERTFVFTNDYAALRPDSPTERFEARPPCRRRRARDVPGGLLLAAPRPDDVADGRWRMCVRSSTSGLSSRSELVLTTAGSRSSRTAARRWARPIRIPTARSGRGRPSPPMPPARTPASGGTSSGRPTPAARLRRPRRRAASGSSSRTTRGWSSCRSGRRGPSRPWSSPRSARSDSRTWARPSGPTRRYPQRPAGPLRQPLRASVSVLPGLASGPVRRARERPLAAPRAYLPAVAAVRVDPQVHGGL